jgi:DNA-binding NarL/FixJ family response regulator
MTDGATPGPRIRVVLVDDQELMRTAFRIIFDETEDIEVVGEAPDGGGAVEVVRRTRPDVVLMDIRMPGIDGIEASRRIRSQAGAAAEPRILVLTTFDLDEYVYEALRAGASGFLLKDALTADLIAAVRTVAAGEAVTAPSITRRLIDHFVQRPPARPRQADRPAVLTEREVLTLIALGRSSPEIAEELYLSASKVARTSGGSWPSSTCATASKP